MNDDTMELVKISSPAAGRILEDLSLYWCETCRFRYQCPDAYTEEGKDYCGYYIPQIKTPLVDLEAEA